MRGKNNCVKCDSNKDVVETRDKEFLCSDCLNKYSLWFKVKGNCKKCGLSLEDEEDKTDYINNICEDCKK